MILQHGLAIALCELLCLLQLFFLKVMETKFKGHFKLKKTKQNPKPKPKKCQT